MNVARNRVSGPSVAFSVVNQVWSLRMAVAALSLLAVTFYPSRGWAAHGSSEPSLATVVPNTAASSDSEAQGAPEPPLTVIDESPRGGHRPPMPAEPIEIVETEPAPHDAAAGSCEASLFSDDLPERCSTPRFGTLSGGYLALDVGFFEPSRQAAAQAGIGAGAAASLRIGFELWDTLVLGAGLSGLLPADERPTSENVVTCTSIQGAGETCETSGHPQESEIGGGLAATFEVGLQHRFRPWRSLSISPGAMLGYAAAFHSLNRGVACDGCSSTDLGVSVSGAYATPFLRVTFGQRGMYAAVVRSAWFLSGEMQHMTTLGIEVFAP